MRRRPGKHVRLRNVGKTFGSGSRAVRALQDVDLDVSVGELLVVTGPPGCGKTTLAHVIGAVERPTTGEVVVAGCRIDRCTDRARLEFQTHELALAPQTPLLAPTLSAYETVWHAGQLAGVTHPEERAIRLLRAVGLAGDPECPVAALGERDQHRVSLARALGKDAPLLVADQPLICSVTETCELLRAALDRCGPARTTTVILTAAETPSSAVADHVVQL